MKQLIAMLMLLTMLSSCKVTEEKAKDWAYSNKDKLAEWCADCFPVKPSEVIPGKTVILPGDTIVTTDTVKVQVDCPDGTKADCPPGVIKTIRDTLYQVDTIKIRDTAVEQVLANDRDSHKHKLDNMTESRDKYRKWFWISIAIIAGYSLIKILVNKIRI